MPTTPGPTSIISHSSIPLIPYFLLLSSLPLSNINQNSPITSHSLLPINLLILIRTTLLVEMKNKIFGEVTKPIISPFEPLSYHHHINLILLRKFLLSFIGNCLYSNQSWIELFSHLLSDSQLNQGEFLLRVTLSHILALALEKKAILRLIAAGYVVNVLFLISHGEILAKNVTTFDRLPNSLLKN